MTRKIIAQYLKEAANQLGYCFYCGFDYRMAESIIAYPAMWLSPPKIVAAEGRREGRVKYRLCLQLMKLCGKPDAQHKEEAWCALEADALEVYRMLAENKNIASITLAECAPGEFSLTNHGELSMALKLDVEIPFCNL